MLLNITYAPGAYSHNRPHPKAKLPKTSGNHRVGCVTKAGICKPCGWLDGFCLINSASGFLAGSRKTGQRQFQNGLHRLVVHLFDLLSALADCGGTASLTSRDGLELSPCCQRRWCHQYSNSYDSQTISRDSPQKSNVKHKLGLALNR